MAFEVVYGDITHMDTDAIVNAANTELSMGGGVCGAIFSAAGEAKLQAACDLLAPIATGQAVITPGFDLATRYIIHTAGPIWRDGKSGEEALLRDCYRNSLALAHEHGCRSIAFPLISSGIFGYPPQQALEVATSTIEAFIKDVDMEVYLVRFR